MTLRQLEVFLAVAREKSFSLAAKRIHSSQPTLSEHISELESELGKQLFFRLGRRRVATVTEAGRVFEQFAERAVSAVEGARRALADLDGLAHGSLLIGASTTPGLYVLPRISSKVSRSDWRATPRAYPRALLCLTRPLLQYLP